MQLASKRRSSYSKLNSMTGVTQLLDAAAKGDAKAASELLLQVYDELKQLAAVRLASERPGQTLQATALVHEAYLRLVGPADTPKWYSRGHFFAAAAEAMRRILIEQARRKSRVKHSGGLRKFDLDSDCNLVEPDSIDLLSLNEAMTRLSAIAPIKAKLVELRFFAGLTMPEAASVLDISLATAERYWTFAKSWLYAELAD